MKLVGIQRTERDKKEERERWEQPMPSEDYPYGLALRLDDATIRKLGLDTAKFSSEDRVRIEAVGFISEETSNRTNGKQTRSMTVQITELAVGAEDETDAASIIYDNK